MITEPYMLSAVASVEAIASGSLSSVDLIKSCLSRISETEPEINAWEYLDAESAIAQASKCDEIRKAGKAIGPLHGVPVGLKDIIDTIDMPTQCGSDIFLGRISDKDARVVENLRNAGAVIMGKTVTTEMAVSYTHLTLPTRNCV